MAENEGKGFLAQLEDLQRQQAQAEKKQPAPLRGRVADPLREQQLTLDQPPSKSDMQKARRTDGAPKSTPKDSQDRTAGETPLSKNGKQTSPVTVEELAAELEHLRKSHNKLIDLVNTKLDSLGKGNEQEKAENMAATMEILRVTLEKGDDKGSKISDTITRQFAIKGNAGSVLPETVKKIENELMALKRLSVRFDLLVRVEELERKNTELAEEVEKLKGNPPAAENSPKQKKGWFRR